MNKAQIKLELNELINIDNTIYHVAEHPALPGVPYIQRGARGFVIQLKSPGPERYALKYFKIKYRVPDLVIIGKALRQYADLPGLRAAYRTVFTQETHSQLIRKYPALEYGVLMPWVQGTTWFDMVTKKVALAPLESVRLAQETARVLATLEAAGLAHCDIAGANVMVDRKANRVELVDIEEMYGSGLPRPVELPAGQDGYQHKTSAEEGQWTAEGDRFGGAVLLVEMLAWQNQRLRENSADEHFFAAAELQQPDTPRYRMLMDYLRAEYSPEIASAFESAWRSVRLEGCPPLHTWSTLLSKLETTKLAPAPRTSEVVSGRRTLSVNPPVQTGLSPVVPTEATSPQPVPATTKLCPRCGAANLINAEFCVKCHYYLKGDQRPAQRTVGLRGTSATSLPNPNVAASGSNRIASSAVSKEVISARRMVGPGQSGQTVPSAPEPNVDGRWLVVAIVIGFVITLLVFAMVLPRG